MRERTAAISSTHGRDEVVGRYSRPDQVQDFNAAPLDVATAMYDTGIDPFTKKPVFVAKPLRDRTMQRALMQFFKPENYFEVRRALIEAG